MDNNSLERFVEAQEHTYELALREIMGGQKRSHWMWYIFPQLRSLGRSYRSYFYGIENLDEAKRYIAHPILGKRLVEICNALILIQGKSAEEIFGSIDAMKLRSSMTLFSIASMESDSIFKKILERFFDGEEDNITLELLQRS